MKVLKEGNPGGLWTPEVTCTGAGNGNDGCGALLEINSEDVFHTKNTDYGGGTDHYFTIECPNCKKWTDLDEEKTNMPRGVRTKVLDQPSRFPNRTSTVRNNDPLD